MKKNLHKRQNRYTHCADNRKQNIQQLTHIYQRFRYPFIFIDIRYHFKALPVYTINSGDLLNDRRDPRRVVYKKVYIIRTRGSRQQFGTCHVNIYPVFQQMNRSCNVQIKLLFLHLK